MGKSYKILIAGDMLPSAKNSDFFAKGDSNAIFGQKICQLFKDADFSIINLEGALTNSEQQQEKVGPSLKAPTETIAGIKNLGVTALALANNHIMDYCDQGYHDTISTVENAGILHVGTGTSCDDVKPHLSINLGSKRICIYNVSETFFNQPGEKTPGVNRYDEWIVLNEIRELKRHHDYIIVIYHGGVEEFPYPSPLVMKRFHRMADCGADFITAQHTHCIGCEEHYNNSYLLYGQGNFLFDRMKSPISKHGLITQISFSEERIDIKHHCISVSNMGIMQYDDRQDFSDFKRRSDEINDMRFVVDKYEEFAYNYPRIISRNLRAFRGRSLVRKILSKILPSSLFRKYFLENYSPRQLLLMKYSLMLERPNEDITACLKYMMKNKKK